MSAKGRFNTEWSNHTGSLSTACTENLKGGIATDPAGGLHLRSVFVWLRSAALILPQVSRRELPALTSSTGLVLLLPLAHISETPLGIL